MAYAYRMAVGHSHLKQVMDDLIKTLPFKVKYLVVYNDKETFLFVSRELFPTGIKGYFAEITMPIRKATVEKIRANLDAYSLFGNKSLL